MELHALRLSITEEEINDWVGKALANERRLEVRDLRVALTVEGALVSGVYESRVIDVPFESLWELSVAGGRVGARLAKFRPLGGMAGKAFGLVDALSSGSMRSLLMQAISEAVTGEPTLKVEGDTIFCDVDGLVARHGVPLHTNLTALKCEKGQLWIEAGTPLS